MIKKRLADWLEKISAGSAFVALFQNNLMAVFISVVAILLSLLLSRMV